MCFLPIVEVLVAGILIVVVAIVLRHEFSNRKVFDDMKDDLRQHSMKHTLLEPKLRYQSKSRYRPALFTVAVRSPGNTEFTISDENIFDAVAKTSGFSTEIQTGDPGFDDAFYIMTDDEGPLTRYLMNEEVRRAVVELFRLGFTKLEGHAGRIEAVSGAFADRGKPDMRVALGWLEVLSIHHPKSWNHSQVSESEISDKLIFGTLFLIGVVTAALFYLTPWSTFPEGNRVFVMGLKTITPLAFIFIGSAVYALQGRSVAHYRLRVVLLISVFLFPLLGISAVQYINCAMDTSQAKIIQTVVMKKDVEFSWFIERAHDKSFLYLRSWNLSQTDMKIIVSDKIYQQASEGQPVQLRLRQGRLGLAWIEDIQLLS